MAGYLVRRPIFSISKRFTSSQTQLLREIKDELKTIEVPIFISSRFSFWNKIVNCRKLERTKENVLSLVVKEFISPSKIKAGNC